LEWLRSDKSSEGQEDLAIVTMLLRSGLRGSEFCQLSWDRVQYSDEDGWYFHFTVKGGGEQEQELYAGAVTLAKMAFTARFGRERKPADPMFHSLPAYQGDQPRPLAYHAL
jgi:site-specific recombinase XerC